MHSPIIEFRRVSKSDVDAIVDLWMDSSTYHKELDSRLAVRPDAAKHVRAFFSKLITDEINYFAVASVNNTIIGYICVLIQERPPTHFEKTSGFIDGLYVRPDYRRQGVGSELYQMALKWLKEHHIESIRLTVSSKNSIGQAFWNRQGFSELMYLMLATI
ncbi:MAG: GNAT family N-acetyltransferase [Candidatus Thorarchaeota archaeon]|nr:GNAT family N-acetyltransferase [Candidatus Thorarchaeota archaeon]